MKTVFKLLAGFIIGLAIGIAVSAVIIVLFTDISMSEFCANFYSCDMTDTVLAALVGIGAFVLSLVLLIPAHEAGHLVCGLLTGYKFVSFRVFNLTFFIADGKIRMKHYAIAGTGGQCLMTPPDIPVEKIPTSWYNAGGVLANIVLLLIMLPFLWLDLNSFLFESIVVFCLTDALLIIMNGIPMKLGGIGNDAYNMIYLKHNLLSKRALVLQLRTNALIQAGTRPKDMPDCWFEWNTAIDYRNPLEVSMPLMYASRLIDEMKWEQAYDKFEELYSHKSEIMQLYIYEIAYELAFCAMVTGRIGRAEEILDAKLLKYIEAYRKVMSSKQRIICAKALYLDNDREKAVNIYNALDLSKDKYLLQGEVKSDLAIMKQFLSVD